MMIYTFLFILGLIVGSFLNVLIYRLPRDERIGFTRSMCPKCKAIIRWYDNIPLVSYIALKAKCRKCGCKISERYFVVELVTAMIFCVMWKFFPAPILFAVYSIFVSLLIAASFIDLEFLIIPDELNIAGIIVGLVGSMLYPKLIGADSWWRGGMMSLLGIIISGGVLYITAITAGAILKKEAMGMGDVKLLAMIGSITGWRTGLLTIFVASLLGSIVGLSMIALRKIDIKGKIPFGPYLAAGSIIVLWFGKDIINLYNRVIW